MVIKRPNLTDSNLCSILRLAAIELQHEQRLSCSTRSFSSISSLCSVQTSCDIQSLSFNSPEVSNVVGLIRVQAL